MSLNQTITGLAFFNAPEFNKPAPTENPGGITPVATQRERFVNISKGVLAGLGTGVVMGSGYGVLLINPLWPVNGDYSAGLGSGALCGLLGGVIGSLISASPFGKENKEWALPLSAVAGGALSGLFAYGYFGRFSSFSGLAWVVGPHILMGAVSALASALSVTRNA